MMTTLKSEFRPIGTTIRKTRTALRTLREEGWRQAVILLDRRLGRHYLDLAKDAPETYVSLSKTSFDDLGLSQKTVCPRQTTGWELEVAMKALQISPEDKILDLGCGKGAAMLILAKYPFSRIDGVEVSKEWARIAKRNLRRLWLGRRSQVYCEDAREFTDLDQYSHIYMFNPFPRDVLKEVMVNLVDSVKRNPRKLTIVYNSPKHHDLIVASGTFEKLQEIAVENRTTIGIYQSFVGERD
jgi:methylase of polypeptide subunit release factors